ncbi:FMN-binding glutamate synthase family protein [Bacillus tianshenii]|nr:FMN-binding glutamate synthase family protein [Bacillus tianshenii]
MSLQTILLGTMTVLFIIGILLIVILWFARKAIVKKMVASFMKIVFLDDYEENIMELFPGLRRFGLQRLLENSLRATSGEVLHRPLGSVRKWPTFEPITFLPAQTTPFPISSEVEVDTKVKLGPRAKKPLEIDIPIMVSGMGFGVGLSEKAKVALARGSAKAKTAICSGEGPFLQEERDAASKYILQYSKTPWSKERSEIQQADMIEIKFGQGALAAMGSQIQPKDLPQKALDLMKASPDDDMVIIYERFFENQSLKDFRELVDELRELTGGVPIGAKMMMGGKIEEDLDHLLEIGVDVIALDGGQAASHDAPTITQDDFGIPTLHGLFRAIKHLENRGVRQDVSIICSGGLSSPGDYLKAMALGADAVYIGSALVFALAHDQVLKAVPFEPPTQVVWANGKYKDDFDVAKGADAVYNFLEASAKEVKVGLRAMGKTSLDDLSMKDLVSYDEHTAKMLGIPYTFRPFH